MPLIHRIASGGTLTQLKPSIVTSSLQGCLNQSAAQVPAVHSSLQAKHWTFGVLLGRPGERSPVRCRSPRSAS